MTWMEDQSKNYFLLILFILSLKEFSDMITPKKIEYYKVMKNKKSSSVSDSGIFEETKSIIKNLKKLIQMTKY